MTALAAGELSAQVVIAGAGPVGLLLGCELLRAGVPVVIVERLAEPMNESRASQLSTLTAELLNERGFDSLLAEATGEPRAHFGGLTFDLSGLDSAFAGNWKVPQYRTEAAFGERASRLGATLLRAHELTHVAVERDHVLCTARAASGDVRIRARYLVGCDGADSTVRRLCGFTSCVTAATKELLRADVTGIDIPDRRFERLDGGFAAASTRGGVTRVMVHGVGQPAHARDTPPGFGEVVSLWEKVTGEDISAGNPVWVDAFDNSRGQVDRYSRGPVLLAGDAAHWHMPIGGQSLNIGLQDAVNLGWKLAGVVNGWAAPGLVDTYHDERHPVAARMLSYIAAQEAVLLGGGEMEPLRRVLDELIALGVARDHLARLVSGLDDRYGGGSPAAGRRLPGVLLRDADGSVVTAGLRTGTEPFVVRLTPVTHDAGDAIALASGFRIRTLHAIAGGADSFPGITTILVRPDGYIAWAGDNDAELSGAIARLCSEGGRNEGF